jgi:2,3-bisphosphoglycerate-independent phosphoglycerate mutase
MRILFLFFDGVGLGENDPANNPFAAADLPTLSSLTAGQRWLNGLPRIESERATFVPTDACLGVSGRPQSATGQAAIMTGSNVPEQLGYHYGPKPNPEIASIIKESGLVRRLTDSGLRSGLLNAYPSTFIENIERGKRLPSSNQMALRDGGVRLLDGGDLLEKRAMSAARRPPRRRHQNLADRVRQRLPAGHDAGRGGRSHGGAGRGLRFQLL